MAQNFPRPTKTYRGSSYPAISPLRPELSLDGKTALITGGATGIGLETTKAFAQAGASSIHIVSRTQDLMTAAKTSVENVFPDTKIHTHAISITDFEAVNKLVAEIGRIDILVLNAAVLKVTPAASVSMVDLRQMFDVNVLGSLNLLQSFLKLPTPSISRPRTVIYTSALGINFPMHGTAGYSASKAAMTYLMRCIDEESRDKGVRCFAFHPCVGYTRMASDELGLKEDSLPFDTLDLPAHFAVWLCSPEADFLQGRFVSANWDVDELAAKKEQILSDPSLLQAMVKLDGIVE